ncbi:MAG: AraC family transcriptional regulator [Ruminococcaceae bacterium]|nr:AraC family transcriptional regulator [Oscillospiraceae bacterium]
MRSLRIEAGARTQKIESGMHKHHAHKSYEIYYLKSGERSYFIEDNVYPLLPGDFALISGYVLHKTSGKNFERILLNFDYDDVPEELRETIDCCFSKIIIHTPAQSRQYIELLLERMQAEYKENGVQPFLVAQFTCLVMEIERFSVGRTKPTDAAARQILEIVRFINQNYAEELTVESLAERAFLSRSHFCRQFKKVTGFSPLEYIHSMRLRCAENLLENTDLSITEIAIQSGFSGSNYFGDLFRRYRGVSPRQWRQAARDGNV